MASPFGHSLAAYFIFLCRFRSISHQQFKVIFIFILIANAPDFDFIPGLLIGKPNTFHHGISHSLGFGVLFCLFLNLFYKQQKFKKFFVDFTLYSSHLVLDYFSFDGRPPFGIPLFWPISGQYHYFSHPILPPIMHSSLNHATMSQFLVEIFSIHNLKVIFLEISIFLPFLVIILFLKRLMKSSTQSKNT